MILLILGSKGPEVEQLQRNLNFLGFTCGAADGKLGSNTERAVRKYQETRGLSVDGKVRIDPAGETWTRIKTEVRWVQDKLREHKFDPGVSDGLAGPRTIAATMSFQLKFGLVSDGIAGSNTRGELQNPTKPIAINTKIPRPAPKEFKILPRSVWGAKPPKQVNPQSGKTFEIVHHTESASSGDELAEIRGIQNYHMDTRGWNDIAYNFLIGRNGDIYEGRGLHAVGAHTVGYNTTGIGVACLGDYQTGKPSAATLKALDSLTAYLKGLTVRTVKGHCDCNATACPGKNLVNAFKR